MVLRALHLCSGYGGFELALRGEAVTVAHVERDVYAASVLVARMAEERLDQAPIWDDLETFDGTAWRGCVDIITAGFPCQPFSAAGQRRGVDDDRWLWPEISRIIRDVGPEWVLLENVPQLVRHGLPYILDDLAQDGFDAEWGLLSAAAVGAPHKRERIWIVAVANNNNIGFGGVGRLQPSVGTRSDPDRQSSKNVADPASARCVGDARQQVQSAESCPYRFPPRPDDGSEWARWIDQGGPEPSIRRGVDGRPTGLADALHLGGNGLVPQCAAEAWRQLTERLGR